MSAGRCGFCKRKQRRNEFARRIIKWEEGGERL